MKELITIINKYKKALSEIQPFLTELELYKSELDVVNTNIDILNKKLRCYDTIDFLLSKSTLKIKNLKFVNKLIQQIKQCKNELLDNNLYDEYMYKSKKVYEYLVDEGMSFIHNNMDTLYMNDDFVIFTNLLDSEINLKQKIIWYRKKECDRKINLYNGDLEIFYRMLIKQELLIWSKLFYNDFIYVLNNIHSEKFSFFEKYIYSVLLKYLGSNPEPILEHHFDEVFSGEEFLKSSIVQDKVYDIIFNKCYKKYFNIFEI